jgi:tRNA-uridine 2-sulfurtransferase
VIIPQLAGLVIRYGKKIDGVLMEAEVMIDKGTSCEKGRFAPLADAECDPWRI